MITAHMDKGRRHVQHRNSNGCSVCNIQRKAAKDYDKYKTDQIHHATLAARCLHISSINCLNDGAPRCTDVNDAND